MSAGNRRAALWLLGMAFVVLLFNSGSRFAIGLLLKPMALDLDWARSTLSLAVTVFMVITALALPLIGRAVDRFGPQRVLLGGILLSAGALALMMLIDSPLQAIVVYGVLFGIGSAATSVTPIGVMVTRYFPERAGIANSIAISGMGVGQLLIIMILASQLHRLGWRGTFVALALGHLLILLPLVLLATRLHLQSESAVPADASRSARQTPDRSNDNDYAFLRSRRLWLLLSIYAICGLQDFFVATHVVAFALDQGVSPLLAGNMLALMGLFGLAGVLAAGVWSDKSGPLAPTAACFVLRIVIFLLLLLSRDTTIIVTVIVLFALLYGATFWVTAPLTVVFARAEFGTAQLGVITGLITMVHHIAGGLGAYIGAALFDSQGHYDSVFQLMLGLSLLAVLLCLAARRQHDK